MRSQLANSISGARLGLAIAIMAVASHPVLAWWMLVVAVPSDFLDGFVARRLGTVSSTGQQLDVLADTALAVAVLMYLFTTGWLPVWATITITTTSAASYYVFRSRLLDLLWVRLAAVLAIVGIYGVMVAGFACRAYGWHAYYVAVMAITAASVAWIYRRHIRDDIIHGVAQAPQSVH